MEAKRSVNGFNQDENEISVAKPVAFRIELPGWQTDNGTGHDVDFGSLPHSSIANKQ